MLNIEQFHLLINHLCLIHWCPPYVQCMTLNSKLIFPERVEESMIICLLCMEYLCSLLRIYKGRWTCIIKFSWNWVEYWEMRLYPKMWLLQTDNLWSAVCRKFEAYWFACEKILTDVGRDNLDDISDVTETFNELEIHVRTFLIEMMVSCVMYMCHFYVRLIIFGPFLMNVYFRQLHWKKGW
jgi:hypothetical protein